MKRCTCNPEKGREAVKGKPGVCVNCGGKFATAHIEKEWDNAPPNTDGDNRNRNSEATK